jgi:hypothetical protein
MTLKPDTRELLAKDNNLNTSILKDLLALEEKISQAEEALNSLLQARTNIYKRYKIACPNCMLQLPISNLVYFEYHFYVRPHGCFDGDYYTHSPSWDYTRCSTCGVKIRPLNPDMRTFFKEVQKHYDR